MTNDPRVTRQARTSRRRARTEEVQVLRVNRAVWRAAMNLADGDRTRITVLSATKVEVR